jgi:nucleoside-diphosphate-sugar epimerase
MMTQPLLNEKINQTSPYSIMVTGVTGFIGSRLLSLLSSNGYTVTGLSRKKLNDVNNVKYIQADVFDKEQLIKSMQGIEVAYYLLHSMEGSKREWQEFANREKVQAQNFLEAATKAAESS